MALKTISVTKMSNSDVRLSVNFGILSNAKNWHHTTPTVLRKETGY